MFGLKEELTEPALTYALKAMGAFDNGLKVEIQLTQEQIDHLKYEIDGRLFHYFDGKVLIDKPVGDQLITQLLAEKLRQVAESRERFDLLRFSYNRGKRKLSGRIHTWAPSETKYKKLLNQFFYFKEKDTVSLGRRKVKFEDLRIYRVNSSDEREKLIYQKQSEASELQYTGHAIRGHLFYLSSDQLSEQIISDINQKGLSIFESARKRRLFIEKVVPYFVQKGEREEIIPVFKDEVKAVAFRKSVIFIKQGVLENYKGHYEYEHPKVREFMRNEARKMTQNFYLKKGSWLYLVSTSTSVEW